MMDGNTWEWLWTWAVKLPDHVGEREREKNSGTFETKCKNFHKLCITLSDFYHPPCLGNRTFLVYFMSWLQTITRNLHKKFPFCRHLKAATKSRPLRENDAKARWVIKAGQGLATEQSLCRVESPVLWSVRKQSNKQLAIWSSYGLQRHGGLRQGTRREFCLQKWNFFQLISSLPSNEPITARGWKDWSRPPHCACTIFLPRPDLFHQMDFLLAALRDGLTCFLVGSKTIQLLISVESMRPDRAGLPVLYLPALISVLDNFLAFL